MKKARIIACCSAFFLLVYWLFPSPVHACSCVVPGPLEEELAESSAVFSGKVIRIDENKAKLKKEVVFKVNEIWKGVNETQIVVETPNQSGACGFDFVEGQEFLVYARANADGKLKTTICSRTKAMSAAKEDLNALDKGKSPAKQVEVEQGAGGKTNILVWSVFILSGFIITAVYFLKNGAKK
ncbi:hypothetical protein ACFO25_15705 [Paenactinomyces guangxiensis]|uniref:Tissue inhibitor of metalloproteinase n=1 Tax=Paenactinomyces guangxiensis TaxID=1490290 RepID=A0A7W1WU16_9BACL|nr:hypothetical protein [Paenactinomyces guangxiensis]MBA4496027.1 hypothetical protein [Paenactinomyces guangxiensis]MBH8593097.1 hypothetical protein [Paenactinomyces guangxiensis]